MCKKHINYIDITESFYWVAVSLTAVNGFSLSWPVNGYLGNQM